MTTKLLSTVKRARMGVAVLLAIGLVVGNEIVLPSFLGTSQITRTLGTLAPFVLVGMASTPSFLSGGGGIDLSITPLMALANIVLVTQLLGTTLGAPELAIPILILLGALVGALNGILVTRLRFPPVIATLGGLFVLSGLDLGLAPNPVAGSASWLNALGGSVGPIPGALFTMGIPLLAWGLLRRTAFVESILAVGDNDAAALSAGVKVDTVRISAYAFGGALAGVAGIALTALEQSADATTWSSYTVAALAAVALGGSNLLGGRGGLLASAVGAACIYLLDNLLVSLQVSSNYVQVAYGGVLLFAIAVGAMLFNRTGQIA